MLAFYFRIFTRYSPGTPVSLTFISVIFTINTIKVNSAAVVTHDFNFLGRGLFPAHFSLPRLPKKTKKTHWNRPGRALREDEVFFQGPRHGRGEKVAGQKARKIVLLTERWLLVKNRSSDIKL
jgi:hypothetical protein